MAYSAGLLHDIGRWKEYQGEGDHAGHSAALAESILERAGFKPSEQKLILKPSPSTGTIIQMNTVPL